MCVTKVLTKSCKACGNWPAVIFEPSSLDGALRLAAKRHESAESVNLTWTVYQA